MTFTEALRPLFPGEAETLFLRACLGQPDAWDAFRQFEPDPDAFARQDSRGFKQFLPLLSRALECSGQLAGDPFRPQLRLAVLREELRWNTFQASARDVLRLVTGAGFTPIVTGGTALAVTVYAEPVLRHVHDLDLLVSAAELPFVEVILAASTIIEPATSQTGALFRHTSGLEIRLHSTLTQPPHRLRAEADVRAAARQVDIFGVAARVPAPADLLIQALANGRGTRHGRWASDAATIISRCPDLAWDTVVASGGAASVQIAAMAHYLADQLSVPIPALEALDRRAAAGGTLSHEIAAGLLRPSAISALHAAITGDSPLRQRASLAFRTAIPSAAYQRAVEAPAPSPAFHLRRAARFATTLARQ